MTDTQNTIEAMRAELGVLKARAEMLEALMAGMHGIVVELQRERGTDTFRTGLVGGIGVQSLLGYSVAEVVAQPDFWMTIIHPDDRDWVRAEHAALVPGGEIHLRPYRLLRKDGSEVWVESHLMFREGTNGAPDQIHGVLLDVDHHVRAQEETRRRLERDHLLLQRFEYTVSSIDGIIWENYFQLCPEKNQIPFVSDRVEAFAGYTIEEWLRPNFWVEVTHPEDRETADASVRRMFEEGSSSSTYRWIHKDGPILWVSTRMTLIRDEAGIPIGIRGVTLNVTDAKQADEERAETHRREEIIRAQAQALQELSTPLVPIDDELMAMPLVGTLDARRAELVITALLDGVVRSGARTVILDVTGASAVDEQTAEALLRAARAVSLLGTEVVLTGIRAEVARTLVTLNANLGALTTRGTLKAGIAYAMEKRRGVVG
ncbi:PAS domain-containing protein [Sorangium sp. So ce363]|uniref:PAS domain-containing protein n=1 Tax=Sorangium sp. So ce363 TaxID=3133304 RepID=UPI003F5DBA7E